MLPEYSQISSVLEPDDQLARLSCNLENLEAGNTKLKTTSETVCKDLEEEVANSELLQSENELLETSRTKLSLSLRSLETKYNQICLENKALAEEIGN